MSRGHFDSVVDLLWTEGLQHTNVLERVRYPSWIGGDSYQEWVRSHREVLKRSWNHTVHMLQEGRYSELRSISASLGKRLEGAKQREEATFARIQHQRYLQEKCREKAARHGKDALIAAMLPLSEHENLAWSVTYPVGYGSEDLVEGTYEQDYQEREVQRFVKDGDEPEVETFSAREAFLKMVHAHLSGQESAHYEQVPGEEQSYSFSADTTWGVTMDEIDACLEELWDEKEGLESLQELIRFRRSVIQNVLSLHEIFGGVTEWNKLSEEKQEQLSRPRTYKSKLKNRKAAVVRILLKRDENGGTVRRGKWKSKSSTDLLAKVESMEGLTGGAPGNTARKYFSRHLEHYPGGRGSMEGWFELAEKWASEMNVWD